MTTFHPAFDIKTKTWFVDNFEAPSIKQLKKLLPRRAKIKGYFPNGFKDIPPWPAEQTRISAPYQFKPPQFANPKAPPVPVANWRKQVLDLWIKGLPTNQIGNRLGIKRGVISGIVSRARAKGDARAVKRMAFGGKNVSRQYGAIT
jgi:hypothetical protein